ncbi:MAG TPA: uroporphyrinogen-III synthase [Bacteroidaceae bacterium]|nr:uroporphyrinogen-III synthase [Bacteroidaceae bacterium]
MKVKKILISQPKPVSGKSPYYELSEKYGVEIVFRQFIKIEPLSTKEFRQQKVSIPDHTAVVFTSRHAVDHFFQLCSKMRITVSDEMKYFCITETVALYIQKYVQYRKRKVFFGTTGRVDSLMTSILKHKTEKYFIPVSNVHTGELKALLNKNNISHSEAVMYKTVSNDFFPEDIQGIDIIVFFSPAGVDSLLKNVPNYTQNNTIIGCFGNVTAKAIIDAGLRLDIEAPVEGITSMSAALDVFLSKNNK